MLHKVTYSLSVLAFFCTTLLFSCSPNKKEKTILSLKDVTGIKFIETRREYDTGLSFSNDGFQQVPEWTLYFLPGDSVKIYSPFEKKYLHYPIYYDHQDVVNFAREWLRVIYVSKDSLVLQLLEVQSKKVIKDLSKVYMRFYSEAYIRNVLHQNSDSLRKPDRRDTLFIRRKVSTANRFSNMSDSVFAARNPVQFKSTTSNISILQEAGHSDPLNVSAADEYLYPEYTIIINNAYKDFTHTFNAIVDQYGKITVTSFAVLDKEDEGPKRRVMQAVVDVYLQHFLKVTPGSTLGMPHATEILLHVKGNK